MAEALELQLEVPEGRDLDEYINEVMAARTYMLPFCQWMSPWYEQAPHLEMLCRELEAISQGENDRLIVEIPVRHGKSVTVSEHFPAYYLGHHPDDNIVSASYGAELGEEFGRRARDVILNPKFQTLFPGIEINPDSRAKGQWNVRGRRGSFYATGIPGRATGRGAHVLNVDDPIKTSEEAYSPAYRDRVYQSYRGDLRTRLEPRAAVIISMARRHDDDLVGRLLNDADAGRWRVICLPGEAEEDDPLGRETGEPLWPERFDKAALLELREELGESEYAAQVQQQPIPEGGAIFRTIERYAEAPDFQRIIIGLDTAFTEGRESDWTAWAAWGIAGKQAYLIDAGDCRLDSTGAIQHMAMFYHSMQARYPYIPVWPVVRKRVGFDRVAAQHLRASWGIPVHMADMPTGNLDVYASMIATYFSGAQAYVPAQGGPWLDKWLQQHLRYGSSRHDDYVATTVYALWYAFRHGSMQRRRQRIDLYGQLVDRRRR